jgi:hypothetical protein
VANRGREEVRGSFQGVHIVDMHYVMQPDGWLDEYVMLPLVRARGFASHQEIYDPRKQVIACWRQMRRASHNPELQVLPS